MQLTFFSCTLPSLVLLSQQKHVFVCWTVRSLDSAEPVAAASLGQVFRGHQGANPSPSYPIGRRKALGACRYAWLFCGWIEAWPVVFSWLAMNCCLHICFKGDLIFLFWKWAVALWMMRLLCVGNLWPTSQAHHCRSLGFSSFTFDTV